MNQEELILQYLKQHGSITSWEAIIKYHITRVSAVIFKLKKAGYNITSERCTGDGKQWVKYTLESATTVDTPDTSRSEQEQQTAKTLFELGRQNHWEVEH